MMRFVLIGWSTLEREGSATIEELEPGLPPMQANLVRVALGLTTGRAFLVVSEVPVNAQPIMTTA